MAFAFRDPQKIISDGRMQSFCTKGSLILCAGKWNRCAVEALVCACYDPDHPGRAEWERAVVLRRTPSPGWEAPRNGKRRIFILGPAWGRLFDMLYAAAADPEGGIRSQFLYAVEADLLSPVLLDRSGSPYSPPLPQGRNEWHKERIRKQS